MTQILIDHLWQSTMFTLLVALLTLAFRRNGANVRFCLWLSASLKFLIPFPLLVALGKHLRWDTAPALHATPEWSQVMDEIAQPSILMTGNFSASALQAATPHWSVWALTWTAWGIGATALLIRWTLQWLKIRSIVKASSSLEIGTPIPVRSTTTPIEPGLFGVIHPTILLPEGVLIHLAREQLDAILAHELSHWRRKDNLTATLHMVAQALFWFHPVVWWIGARLIVERERACDESVIRGGTDRQTYAEGILKVCQFHLRPQLPCVSGVSGGSLRKRIEDVMTAEILTGLTLAKKTLLIIAGCATVAGPVGLGFAISPFAFANGANLVGVPMNDVEMKHYKSTEWGFGLDIPKRWNAFPAVSSNSPSEGLRFASHEDGNHLLIIFREPNDPKEAPEAHVEKVQAVLAKAGFSNFVLGKTRIGSKAVLTLDFDKTTEYGLWSCRHYFITDGTLGYVLGFGSSNRGAMFDLYDRMAKSFVVAEE